MICDSYNISLRAPAECFDLVGIVYNKYDDFRKIGNKAENPEGPDGRPADKIQHISDNVLGQYKLVLPVLVPSSGCAHHPAD